MMRILKRRREDALEVEMTSAPRPGKGFVRWLVVTFIAATTTVAAAAAPRYLRDMDSFRAERVEVLGTRFMPPDQALAASGITSRSSVFDDQEAWRAALLKRALVRDVHIERVLPSTLRITITEAEPIALVPTPELRAVDARGKVLPIDLASAGLDLPILDRLTGAGPDGVVSNPGTLLLVEELNRIRATEPALVARISEMRLATGGFRLMLRKPVNGEALISADADATRLHEIELAFADLAARNELQHLRRLDGRFHEQVIVALNTSNGI
jgi:cell division septal protein FtsQ